MMGGGKVSWMASQDCSQGTMWSHVSEVEWFLTHVACSCSFMLQMQGTRKCHLLILKEENWNYVMNKFECKNPPGQPL
jgi:hypothetical protein